MIFMCAHVYDVVVCGNTVKKYGSWSLTGWPALDYYDRVALLILLDNRGWVQV